MSLDPDAFNAFEAAGWERQAATYCELAGQVTAKLAGALLDAVAVGPGIRLLDIGTGPGTIAGCAAERGAQVVGIDVAEAMLERARARYPGSEFRRADAEELPFRDRAFDAVVGGFVLLHLGRPERAVAEATRILAAGGRAAFTVWDEPSRSRFLGIWHDAIISAGAKPPADLPEGPPAFRFADELEFAALLHSAGLADVRVETLAFTHRVSSGDELWEGLMGGAVRTPPVILAQPEPMLREIRSRFEQLLEQHRTGDGFDLPVSVKLASGRVPG